MVTRIIKYLRQADHIIFNNLYFEINLLLNLINKLTNNEMQ